MVGLFRRIYDWLLSLFWYVDGVDVFLLLPCILAIMILRVPRAVRMHGSLAGLIQECGGMR